MSSPHKPDTDASRRNVTRSPSIDHVLLTDSKNVSIETAEPNYLAGFFMNTMSMTDTLRSQALDGFEAVDQIAAPFQQFPSFIHKGELPNPVNCFTAIVEDFHREFIVFATNFCKLFNPIIEKYCGSEAVTKLTFLYRDSKEDFSFDAFPLRELQEVESFELSLKSEAGAHINIVIPNIPAGRGGQCLLETALALKVQAVNGADRPTDVFRWIRETVGLQDTVFDTLMNIVAIVRAHLDDNGLNQNEYGLSISQDQRTKLKNTLIEQQTNFHSALRLLHLYSLNSHLYSVRKSQFHALSGLETISPDLNSRPYAQIGARLFVLGSSLWVSGGAAKKHFADTFPRHEELKFYGNQYASASEKINFSNLATLLNEFIDWCDQKSKNQGATGLKPLKDQATGFAKHFSRLGIE